jgi:hypothetical protein
LHPAMKHLSGFSTSGSANFSLSRICTLNTCNKKIMNAVSMSQKILQRQLFTLSTFYFQLLMTLKLYFSEIPILPAAN